jgi:tripartite ATP-independent transporter DctM subunit
LTLVILFAVLLVVVLSGIPIILAIGWIGLAGILLLPDLAAPLFVQRMFAVLDNFSLLAMPYFILAGALMGHGGLSRALIDFGQAVVGHLRGSLGHTTVVACMAMANVSGSSAAEAAAIGSIVIPSMKERGYQPGLAASVVGSAALVGPIIPPSMTMIVYGAMTGVSIGGLFMAGVVPGVMVGLGLMFTIYLLSFLPAYPALRQRHPRASFSDVVRAARKAWVALLAPVVILGGIFTGAFTATEAGIVACLYGLVASLFVYRQITWRDLPRVFLDAAATTAMVVGIIAMAGSVGWLLSYLEFHLTVLQALRAATADPTTVLLLLLAVMFLLSMFIESLAVLILLVPVAVYVGTSYGIDPLHLGILLVIGTQLGALTPPVALSLFITTSIAKCEYGETVRHCPPFIAAIVLVMLAIVWLPCLATWLPGMTMGR